MKSSILIIFKANLENLPGRMLFLVSLVSIVAFWLICFPVDRPHSPDPGFVISIAVGVLISFYVGFPYLMAFVMGSMSRISNSFRWWLVAVTAMLSIFGLKYYSDVFHGPQDHQAGIVLFIVPMMQCVGLVFFLGVAELLKRIFKGGEE